jgi:hypothetical protein
VANEEHEHVVKVPMSEALRDQREPVHDSWLHSQLGGFDRVALSLLSPGDSPRFGERDDVVRALAAVDDLPPIIVHRSTMRVLDGHHRLRAARRRGDTEIDVHWYEGTAQDAFLVAVRANMVCGRPLSADEQRIAVARIVQTHTSWSNRMIATITGVSPGTVGSIRKRFGKATRTRIGRDGRERPLSSAEGRRHAASLLAEQPDMTLRQVAGVTGLSPSTVMDVRNRMRAGQDLVPKTQRRAEHVDVPEQLPNVPRKSLVGRAETIRRLRMDPSLRFTDAGRQLLLLLSACPQPEITSHIPKHCLNAVIALARENAEAWCAFVSTLESRRNTGRPDPR